MVNSIKSIKHGFYLPYYFPIIAIFNAIKDRCLLFGIFSTFATIFLVCLGNGNILLKICFLFTFAIISPDIKRLDFIRSGYVNGGIFVEKNKYKAIKKFLSIA